MIHCPMCGHRMEEKQTSQLGIDDEVACVHCARAWVVRATQPLALASPEASELAFTD